MTRSSAITPNRIVGQEGKSARLNKPQPCPPAISATPTAAVGTNSRTATMSTARMPRLPGQRGRRPTASRRRGATHSHSTSAPKTTAEPPMRTAISRLGDMILACPFAAASQRNNMLLASALPLQPSPVKPCGTKHWPSAGRSPKGLSTRMEVFLQQLINGITLGSIYGLIAIGYTMVFGIIGMVNFAHGDVFMVSAFIALIAFLILTTWLGISSIALALFIVLIVAMLFTSLVNWTIE